ncbi:hypothetical protein [Sphingomonas sp.]|uniref:hypothetical protein n=1 Tax=Sphingomonas sp. TaxID=28214 RepID=UPI00307F6113
MAANVILVEAAPRNPADGQAVTVRLAGGGSVMPYRYGGHGWRAGIVQLPTIVASVDFKGDDLGGGGVTEALVLRWAAPDDDALAELAAYHWIDAAITVRVGPEDHGLPPVLVTGKVLKANAQAGVLELALAEPIADLKKPVLTDRFAGTGGVEGPLEWEDRIRPRAWGRVFNLRGEAIDTANNIYCFGDPHRSWQAFDQVRDKGAAAAQLDHLEWQGTVAATFVALQEAAAPQGGGVACPSIACVKWWTQPAGALCADIRGEIGAGYVETAPAIAERIAASVATIPFAPGTVAAAAMIRPAAVGLFVNDESVTVAELLDQLLGDVSLIWVLGDGAITLRPWAWGPSVASAVSEEVSRRTTFKPMSKRKLGYRRNQHVMSRDAIAGIVLATDVIFEDGETVEALQPAAPGATPGAPDGWIIGGTLDPQTGTVEGGLPAEEVLADAEAVQLESLIAAAQAEIARIRDRALMYGEDGADVRTRFRREANARMALAAIVTIVQARLGNVDASVEQLLEAFTDGDEGYARFLLRAQVDEDGQPTSIVGIEGLAGAGGSILKFVADVIQFIHPVTAVPLIYFDTAEGKMKAEAVEVDTLKVNTAVIPVRSTATATLIGVGSGAAWQTALECSIVMPKPGVIEADFLARQSFSSGDQNWAFELLINGIVVFAVNGGRTQDSIPMAGSATVSAGTHTATARWRAADSVTVTTRQMRLKGYPATE